VPASAFVDRLRGSIDLTIGGDKTSIPLGNVKHFELHLEAWGFAGSAELWIVSQGVADPDALFTKFMGQDLATIGITLQRAFDDPDEVAVPMTLAGVVTRRSVTERAAESVQGAPVLQRRYAIEFCDRARACWSRHFPAKVYVGSTLKKLVDDHLPSGMSVTHDWSASSTEHPVLAVGLGEDANDASFYDFAHWLLSSRNAALYYASATDAYAMRDSKPSASGDPESVDRELVQAIDTTFPRAARSTVHVLNGFSDAAVRDKLVLNLDAVLGVRRDVVMRSSIGADLDLRATVEGTRAKSSGPITRLVYRQFPAVPLVPPMQAKLGEGFSAALREGSSALRVIAVTLVLVAERQSASDDTDDETNRYAIEYEVKLESASDEVPRYPAHVTPAWPLFVEGHVVSEVGETTDETYQPYTDSVTSLDRYKVKIPLFSDIQIVAPFDPGFLGGHFYFPLTKGLRVLVAFELDRATIAEVLDWRTGGRLPLDTQGDHLLLGKSATSQTSVRHVYTDGKPVMTIVRTSSSDLQTIEISDGRFYLETKESGGT
jgi:hypothetical protein